MNGHEIQGLIRTLLNCSSENFWRISIDEFDFIAVFCKSSLKKFRSLSSQLCFKPRANGRNIVGCYMFRPFSHPVSCCWMLLLVVAQGLKPVKLFSQQLSTFLLFRDRRSVAQQCWICLYSSSNIVGSTQAHYAWFTKTYGLYPSHDALQVPTLLVVVAYVCIPLPTRTQQLPTSLAQQCWELLRQFARSLTLLHILSCLSK